MQKPFIQTDFDIAFLRFPLLLSYYEKIGGGTPKTNIPEYWNGNIPWLTPADFSNYEEMYVSYGKRNITIEGLNASSAQLLPANSTFPFLKLLAPVIYGIPILFSLYSEGDKSLPYISSHNSLRRINSHFSGISNGIIESIFLILFPIFS